MADPENAAHSGRLPLFERRSAQFRLARGVTTLPAAGSEAQSSARLWQAHRVHPAEFGPGVVLFDALGVRFDEVPSPALPLEVQAAIDKAWGEMLEANPAVFDGPVILCSGLSDLPDQLTVSWSRASFRYRTVRQIPAAPALSSMFACVLQPTSDGRLVVGRMSGSTSSPGLLQFPGGILEPPPPGQPLTISAVARHAAVELREETGICASAEDLRLWVVARRSNGNVGFFFLAPSVRAETVIQRHASLIRAERSEGQEPEFAEVSLITVSADLDQLIGQPVDYLRPLVDRFREPQLTAD